MLKKIKQEKNIRKKYKKKFNLKPWWFPFRARLLKKRNKFYLNWKKYKFYKKYKFFFKHKKRQIYRFKLKKIFNAILIVKNMFRKIYGLNRNRDFNKVLNHDFNKVFLNLEGRLDVIIAKNLNIRNLKQAQNIIKHGLVYVNNKKIYQFNMSIKPMDVIHFERDDFPWQIRNLAFRKKKRRKKSLNCFVSKYIPLIVNFKVPNYKYCIPTKFLNKKTFKILTCYSQ